MSWKEGIASWAASWQGGLLMFFFFWSFVKWHLNPPTFHIFVYDLPILYTYFSYNISFFKTLFHIVILLKYNNYTFHSVWIWNSDQSKSDTFFFFFLIKEWYVFWGFVFQCGMLHIKYYYLIILYRSNKYKHAQKILITYIPSCDI